MKRVAYFFAISVFVLTATPALAQSGTAQVTLPDMSAVPASFAAPAIISTRLSAIVLTEPATEEGFATIRIAGEDGEAVYRGMMPVTVGTRSLDLSRVNIPAAGRYTVRIIYPGGTVVQDVETAYTTASTAASGKMTAGRID